MVGYLSSVDEQQQQKNHQQKQSNTIVNSINRVHRVHLNLNRHIPIDVLISPSSGSKKQSIKIVDDDDDDDEDISIDFNIRIHKTVKVRRSKKRKDPNIRYHPYRTPVFTHHPLYSYTPVFTPHLHK